MGRVEQDEVGAVAGGEAAEAAAEGLRAAGEGGGVEGVAGGGALVRGHHVAGAAVEALGVFQEAEFAGSGDLDVGIGADAVASAGVAEGGGVEDPVAEIGFGDGA